MLSAQELAEKIKADWFLSGSAKWDDEKVTVREVYGMLVNFQIVSRALGMLILFEWDDALEAAQIIAKFVNESIDNAQD